MADKVVIDCETGEETLVPLTPEEEQELADRQAAHGTATAEAAFVMSEDAERLAVIRERAETDPAFAALADIVLSGKGL